MSKFHTKPIAEQILDRSIGIVSIRLLWKLIGGKMRSYIHHGQTHLLNLSYSKYSTLNMNQANLWMMQTYARDSTAFILLNHCYHFFEKQLLKHFATVHEINVKTLV